MDIKNFRRLREMFIPTVVVISIVLFLFGCGKRDASGVDGVADKKKLAIDYYKMSMLELEEGLSSERSYRKALYYINKAIGQKQHPIYLAQKATLLFLLGGEDESLLCFERALSLCGGDSISASIKSEILNNYACVLAKKGDTGRALSVFEKLERDENYLTPEVALVNQARVYYEDGRLVLARQKLDAATRFAPDYVDAHYYLASVCYELGEYRDSIKSLGKTIELESGHAGAIALRERCCEKLMIC